MLNQALGSAESAVDIGRTSGSLIFCFILAAFVWLSTKAVDRFNDGIDCWDGSRFLPFYCRFIELCKTEVLFNTIAEGEQSYLPYLLTALPVCLVSFGFHGNVPSLVKYYDRDGRRVMKSIFIGTGLALVIYILWQLAVQGNLPRTEFAPVIAKVAMYQHYWKRYINTLKWNTLPLC